MIRLESPLAGAAAPLSADDLDRLDALLEALDTDDAMIVEELDGFIAGLVCTPEAVDPAQLLAYACGDDVRDPIDDDADVAAAAYGNPAAANVSTDAPHGSEPGGRGSSGGSRPELSALIARHAASVAEAFERGDYSPVLAYDEQGRADGSAWAVGFLQAVELYPDSWDVLVDEKDFADALDAVETLAATLDDEVARPLNRRERDGLIDRMIGDVGDIYEFFRPYRQSGTTPAALRVETVRRVQPKVGRNDPCPCGSGRKYKLCCGTH